MQEFHDAGRDVIGSLHYSPMPHDAMIAESKFRARQRAARKPKPRRPRR